MKNKIRKARGKSKNYVNEAKTISKKIIFSKKFFTLIGILTIGVIIGSIYAVTINADESLVLREHLVNFFGNSTDSFLYYFNIIINNNKYIVYFLIICLCTKLFFLIPSLIFYKGISYGVTITFLIRALGKQGIKICFFYYIPINILYFIIYLIMAESSVNYILIKNKKKNDVHKKALKIYVIKTIVLVIISTLLSVVEIAVINKFNNFIC